VRGKLSNASLAYFVGPCLPLAGIGLPLVVHLPTYYSRDLGLPLWAVGLAFPMVRMVDMFLDPVIGVAMDRTRTPLGRFRPWLIASTPILMMASLMLFMAKPGVGVVWLWAGLVVAYAGFSMGSLSQQSWASALSSDYNERSRIYGWWQAGNVVGILLVLLLPALVELVLKGTRAQGVQAMGWFVLAALPVTVLLAVSKVGEPAPPGEVRHAAGIKDYLSLFRNVSIVRLMTADLLLGWVTGVTGTLFFFYFDQVKGLANGPTNILLLIYFTAAVAGAPLWSALATRIGKHRALAVSAVVICVSLLLVMAAPMQPFALAAALMILAGLPYSAPALLLRAMLADVGDELRLESGIERTGLLYSVLTATSKVGQALAPLTLVVLGAMNFNASARQNPPEAVTALAVLFVGAPSALALLAAVVIMGYRLDADRHAQIRVALAERE
jgi:GPH family glycoside/pentoside/hexuronide:cation symporter